MNTHLLNLTTAEQEYNTARFRTDHVQTRMAADAMSRARQNFIRSATFSDMRTDRERADWIAHRHPETLMWMELCMSVGGEKSETKIDRLKSQIEDLRAQRNEANLQVQKLRWELNQRSPSPQPVE